MIADKLQRAVALHTQGEFAQAMALYSEVIGMDPAQPDALHLMGVALTQSRQPEPGAEFIARSLSVNPAQPVASANLGHALLAAGQFDAALSSYDRSIALLAGYAPAHNGRGSALAALHRHAEALASFDRALELQPQFPEALTNRGLALFSLKRYEEAVHAFDSLLRLRPGDAQAAASRAAALLFLGTAAMSERRFDQAAAAFERLEQTAPHRDFVPGALLHSQLHLFEWRNHAAAVEQLLAQLDGGATPVDPFSFLAVSDSPERQLACAQRLDRKMPKAGAWVPRGARTPPHARLRVTYISADFLEHPVAFLLAGVFEAHDRDRFEVTAVSLRRDDRSPTARRLRSAFNRFVDVSDRSDEEIAGVIRDLETDIAIDLMGYTAQDRPGILRNRPAPLQVNYLGFPATMGSEHIDYIVADPFVIPAEAEQFFTERVVFLPDCFQANDAGRRAAPTAVSRSAMGLPEAGFVWGSFHTSYKLNPPLFDVWARLLHAVPGSVLWLVSASPRAEANLRREAARRGLDPERLHFARVVQYPQHLARLRLADLCLDTWPFNGGATTSDALWMGVPVVTRAGRSFASRMSGSLLHTAGLPELITDSYADYERVALRLAAHPEELAAIRAKLAAAHARSALFDTPRFTRSLEAAYAAMWDRHVRGEAPRSFSVRRAP